MKLGDCYRIALHTIKENKSRSILTVVISTFISLLLMGMMSLAISFSRNSSKLIKQAYFGENSIVSVEYKNERKFQIENHILFKESYYHDFIGVVDQYSDVVDSVYYETNLLDSFDFVDPKYPIHNGVTIVEGRMIAPSITRNEIIVNKTFYEQSLLDNEIEPQTIGSVHTFSASYVGLNKAKKQVTMTTDLHYVVVGIFEAPEEKPVILNGAKSFITYQNFVGDIGIAFNTNNDDVYISSCALLHYSKGNVNSPEKIINRLSSLTDSLNKTLPPALSVETFQGPPIELLEHYSDGASCNVCEIFNENKAIRYIVVAAAVFMSIILLLISIGSLANSVIISIDCSKKFIGLLKVLGMKGNTLRLVVILESITLISLGVLLGYLLLLALSAPLSILVNMIIGFTYSAYLKITTFTASINIPIYLLFGALIVFLLFTYLFSRTALRKIAKMDPIAVISEVS